MLFRDKVKANNPIAYHIIKNAINSGKVAHAFLFAAPKQEVIEDEPLFLIQSLISDEPFVANDLRKIESYIDLTVIDGSHDIIKKEQVIEAAEKLQEKPFEKNGKKILLIKNLENANGQSLNSLLKFIEEPTPDTYIVMTTNNLSQVLLTIRSRAQVISLKPKSLDKYAAELIAKSIPKQEAHILSHITTSISDAMNLFIDKFDVLVEEILETLDGALRDHYSFFTKLDQKITRKNYDVYLNVLNTFFNDIWKFSEGLEVAFEDHRLLEKYALSNFNYVTALKEINDFLVMQEHHVNFDLYKSQLLIKLVRCYE